MVHTEALGDWEVTALPLPAAESVLEKEAVTLCVKVTLTVGEVEMEAVPQAECVGVAVCVPEAEGLLLSELCPELIEEALALPDRVGERLEVELTLLLPQEEGLPERVSKALGVRGPVPDTLVLALSLGRTD